MNIYQKLIEVRKTCEYLKKDNKGYQFNFVSSSQTLGTLRAAMDEQQLLLVPSVIKYEVRDHKTSKGGHEYFTILEMEFMWVNAEKPEELIRCPWTGQGLDNGEKGVGKALTYAEKYFLLKFFNIATDKDDPDSYQQRTEPKKPVRKLITKQEATNLITGAMSLGDLQSVWKSYGKQFKAELSLDDFADVEQEKDAKKAEFEAA